MSAFNTVSTKTQLSTLGIFRFHKKNLSTALKQCLLEPQPWPVDGSKAPLTSLKTPQSK